MNLDPNQSRLQNVFKASLIYGFISVGLMGVAALFPLFYLLAPILISFAQFRDSRKDTPPSVSYKRLLGGLGIYIFVGFLILPLTWLLIPENLLSKIFDSLGIYSKSHLRTFFLFLPSVIMGAFTLGVIYPTAKFRRANGKRTTLFWLTIIAPILGFLSIIGLALLTRAALNIGSAF